MKSHRRYLTFSLRTLFILLTALAVWLGVVVDRAREQRDAVKAIEALGGQVAYDWQSDNDPFGPETGQPPGPIWLRRLVGDDYFQEVREIDFGADAMHFTSEPLVRNSLPYLGRLRNLERVVIWIKMSTKTLEELRAALPGVRVDQAFVGSF